jgi:hypothetical protein
MAKQRILKYMKKSEDTNCFFGVERKQLMNSYGLPTHFDELVRSDNHETLSVVRPAYKLTEHGTANTFVDDLLAANEIKFETRKMTVARKGSLFQREIILPEIKFDVSAKGIDSKAQDDGYSPRIIIQNSYDRSSSLTFIFGNYRWLCENGGSVGQTVEFLRFPHVKEPDYNEIGKILMEALEKNSAGFAAKAKTLSEIYGQKLSPTLKLLMMEVLSKRLAKKVVELSSGLVHLEYNKDGDIVDVTAGKDATAYMLLQLATEAVSHHVPKLSQRVSWDRRVSSVFG